MKLKIAAIVDASKIASTANGFQKAFKDAVMQTGLRIDRDTKSIMSREYVPDIVDTGRLRSSIHVQKAGDQVTVDAATVYGRNFNYQDSNGKSWEGTIDVEIGPMEVIVGTNVEYAAFHEFGTRKLPARPYLGLAYTRNRGYLAERVKKNAKTVKP
jgi:phage gpG-like protein